VLLAAHTDRYLGSADLSYLLNKNVTLALHYLHNDYSSAKIVADNRSVNRVILEAVATF